MEKQRSDVISGIRACLISTKGKVRLNQLEGDYKTFFGERIPYTKLGYKKLEDFIKSEASLILSKNGSGELFVDAKSSEKSAHITDMVQKQKTSKRKLLRKAVRFAPSHHSAKTVHWRPKDMYRRGNNFHTSTRPAAVSHNQFVNRPNYDKPLIPSKIVIPEGSSFNKVDNTYSKSHLQRQNSQLKKDISTRLQLNGPIVLQERNVTNNGLTVTIESKTAEKSCTSVMSARRRITKKMSQISIDRDSGDGSSFNGNSTPTKEFSAPLNEMSVPFRELNASFKEMAVNLIKPKITEFVRSGDVISDLKTFVDMHKIGHLEIDSRLVKTKQNRLFICKIKIEKLIYTSYPEEFSDPLSAEKYCAELALTDLISKYGRRKSLLLASNKDILEKVPPMLEKHHHGIWGWQLQLDYADKYNEQLPVDWLKIIDSSPCIQVEKCMENYVLRHCKPGDALQKGQKWNTFMTLKDVSVPSNTVQFLEDGRLYAEVTCIMSANEIWCRQCSTEESDTYSEMIIRMETYYNLNENDLKAEKISEAGYYITKYDNTWYRIRAVAVYDDDVHCFFIDYGDEMAVPKSNIYYLKREFALSQAQAFVCRLVGLEELYEASSNSEILQTLAYKQVILEMANEVVENINDLSIPVFMYDFETGNSINQEMIPLLTIESASPVIQKATITEVYVTNIESNGDIYVQLHSHGYDSLLSLLHNLETQILTKPPTELISPVTKKTSEGKIYFAKYKVDGHWYRIQIIDWSPTEDLAQIYFVDYGNTDVINVKEDLLYPLDKLSDVLSQYPFQAVKVRMAIDKIPEDFVALASKAMPEDQPVLVKIVEYDNGQVPWVEFFKRSTDGGLFCINKSITMEAEMKKEDESNPKSFIRKLVQFDGAAKNVPSGGKLQRPSLPNKGEYFEVHVPFAVSPYNFFVQPLASRTMLHKMMEQLQDRYKDVLYSPLNVDQIVPGNIYASKHEDGYWYRTSVLKVIHSGSISVFYCDFGYYANLKVNQLVPLDVKFMQLPYQALKAKLSDIKPKQSKWTMEDCENFKTLVEKKHFYSILIDIEKDELYESDIMLKLLLIDTSSDQDIYIGKELIKEGIAVQVV